MALLSSLFRRPSTIVSLAVRTLGPARSFDRGISYKEFCDGKTPSPAEKGWPKTSSFVYDSKGKLRRVDPDEFAEFPFSKFNFGVDGQKSTKRRVRKEYTDDDGGNDTDDDDGDTDTDEDENKDNEEDCSSPQFIQSFREYCANPNLEEDLEEMFEYLEYRGVTPDTMVKSWNSWKSKVEEEKIFKKEKRLKKKKKKKSNTSWW